MNILLAEDDERLGKLIHHMLKKEFNVVDWVKNGEDAYQYAMITEYDIIILDWMMPILSGLEACQKLRNAHYQGAILFLTAKDAVEDIVSGLDCGADDYMLKPFEFEELLARLRALSRRKQKTFEESIKAHHLLLNISTHSVTRDGERIDLSKKEYHLLELLMRNQKQILTREILIDKIWGLNTDVSENSLDALVKLLRKKIDNPDQPSLIQNIRGVGYKLRDADV